MHVKIILWKINSLISLWFFCINIYFSSIITGHFKIGQASPAFIRNGFYKNQKHYALHMPVVVNLMDKNPNTSACISGILIILNALQGEDYKLVTSKAQLLTARLTVKVLDNNTFSGSTNEFSKLFFVWFQFEVIHCSNNWLQKKCQSCFNKRQAPVVVEVVSDGIWHSQTWCWNLLLKIKHNNIFIVNIQGVPKKVPNIIDRKRLWRIQLIALRYELKYLLPGSFCWLLRSRISLFMWQQAE